LPLVVEGSLQFVKDIDHLIMLVATVGAVNLIN
jgi:hypothetical protein